MVSKFSELFPALVECFTVILCGYISGRLSIITPKQGRGLGKFVSSFALPALLFKSMVELNFQTVSWCFMVAVLLSKMTVFIIILVISLALLKTKPLSRGALYAIFTTQSNDFALGYPLIKALYGESHKEFLQYIYLIAPISMLILNPIGFILLEIDRNRKTEPDYMILNTSEKEDAEDSRLHLGETIDVIDDDEAEDKLIAKNREESVHQDNVKVFSCWAVIKGVLLNPLVFMVLIGLAGHFLFHGQLPAIIGNTLATLANAFSGAALFFLGLTMVGKISKQQGMELVLPCLLIIAKVILLPLLIRQFTDLLSSVLPVYHPNSAASNSTNATESYVEALSDFGYLYGTFPTAPTVVIYATQYGLETDRLAAGMVLCTTLSAPIMYISAWTLSMTQMSWEYFEKEVKVVGKDTSIITLLCSIWCIIIFVIGRKFSRVPHAITLAYIFSLVLSSLGTIFWDGFGGGCQRSGKLFLFGMMFFGVKSARLYAASLAIGLVLVLKKGQRYVWEHCFAFIITPFIIAFVTTVALMTSNEMQTVGKDGVFLYGKAQDLTSLVLILSCFVVTIICLVIIARMNEHHDDKVSPYSSLVTRSLSELSSSDDDRSSPRTNPPMSCCMRARCAKGDIQKGRHIFLLVLVTLSMFIGLCLVTWRLLGYDNTGIYFEVAFLDCVFNFGQGLFVFCLFGLDSDLIIDPFIRLYQKLRFGSENLTLPDLASADKAALLQCLQFTRHHLDDCKLDIVTEHRSGLTVYQNVFSGTAFCDWILERGLVNDRAEAKIYGQNLLLGRVLHHHTHKHYFYDRNYLYKFEEPKTCYRPTHGAKNKGANTPARNINDVPDDPSQSMSIIHNLPTSSQMRPYFGYSFEAHVSGSDTEYRPSSLRKQRLRKYGKARPGTYSSTSNNNSHDPDIVTISERRRQDSLKKIFPRNAHNPHDSSDSSMD